MKIIKKTFVGIITLLMVMIIFVPTARAGNDDSNNKEMGVWWVNDYSDNPSFRDLTETDDDAEGFYNTLYGKGFTRKYNKGDDSAWERQFEKSAVMGYDYSYVDAVDFTYFAGHGSSDAFHFGINKDGDGSHTRQVHYSESQWGDKDLEWIFISACKVLKHESWNNWKPAFNENPPILHGMTGFHTSIFDTPYLGTYFARYLTDIWGPYCIKDAWQKATKRAFDNSELEAAICAVWIYNYGIYIKYWDEYLPGYGSGMMSDPSGTTYIGYVKWTCGL